MLRHETLTGLGVLANIDALTLRVLYVIEFWVVVVHAGSQLLPPGVRSQVLARGSLLMLEPGMSIPPASTWTLTLADGTMHVVTVNPAPPLEEPNYALLFDEPDSLLDTTPSPSPDNPTLI